MFSLFAHCGVDEIGFHDLCSDVHVTFFTFLSVFICGVNFIVKVTFSHLSHVIIVSKYILKEL